MEFKDILEELLKNIKNRCEGYNIQKIWIEQENEFFGDVTSTVAYAKIIRGSKITHEHSEDATTYGYKFLEDFHNIDGDITKDARMGVVSITDDRYDQAIIVMLCKIYDDSFKKGDE